MPRRTVGERCVFASNKKQRQGFGALREWRRHGLQLMGMPTDPNCSFMKSPNQESPQKWDAGHSGGYLPNTNNTSVQVLITTDCLDRSLKTGFDMMLSEFSD